MLFSTSKPDLAERPFSKSNLYLLDLKTLALDTIWSGKPYAGGCSFSPDGRKLLVVGSPSTFGSLGEIAGKRQFSNNYFKLAYFYDLITKKAELLSPDFKPSIENARWTDSSTIWFTADDGDRVSIFRYATGTRSFTKFESGCDVAASFDIDLAGRDIVYTGSSISTPKRAYLAEAEGGTPVIVADPEAETYRHVRFGRTEDFSFKNASGIEIPGRVYYPPDFDSTRAYPMIVYYYGGTTPVTRAFGGRYPFNLFAGNGYVVYVLQPSGAIGFGREFANEHVNNWGETVADEIITGTKLFLAAHKFVDPKKVGCMGASYGGFMTMYLQTRTDIFAAAIAHAGISSIAGYWGEGYWGYLYSAEASAGSFPWNNRQLYVDRSPLFNADKVKTPILLLHGTSDTNVPIGESIQFFTALKLLGKDVEFVKINGSDHIVTSKSTRIQWSNTILAWFDSRLKGEPEWWNELYPKGNY